MVGRQKFASNSVIIDFTLVHVFGIEEKNENSTAESNLLTPNVKTVTRKHPRHHQNIQKQKTNPEHSNLKKNFMAPFFMDGVQLPQATATSRRQFTFYHSVPRNSWYSSWTSQKYKQDSKKKHVSSIRKRFLANVDENKQECFSLRLVLKEKFTDGEKSVKAQVCAR